MTADALRAWVVRANVLSVIALTFLLWGVICALVLLERDVPDLLTGAASALSGALITLLVNSKATPEVPVPVYEAEPPADQGYSTLEVLGAGLVIGVVVWLVLAFLGGAR